MSEADLKRAVQRALEACGLLVIRVQSGGYRGRMRLAPPGTPDLILRLKPSGRMGAVETKASHPDKCNCKSCTAQRAWAVRHVNEGGLYVRARTVDEALRGLELIGESWIQRIPRCRDVGYIPELDDK